MKKIQVYIGSFSLGIAGVLYLLDLTMIKVTFSNSPPSSMSIYPAAFFTLLGVLLMYHGLKPLWHN